MKKIILKIQDELIPLGEQPLSYDSIIIDAKPFLVNYVLKENKISDIKHFMIESYIRNGIVYVQLSKPISKERTIHGYGTYTCEERIECNIEKIKMIDILQNNFLIFANKKDNKLLFERYQIKGLNLVYFDNLEVNIPSKIEIIYKEKNISIDEIETFFKDGIICNDFQEILKDIIYESQSKCIAFKTISLTYFLFLKKLKCRQDALTIEEIFNFYNYLCDEKFNYLFEFNVKNGIDLDYSEIIANNPVFTGKPYEDIRSMRKVSSESMEIINYLNSHSSTTTTKAINLFYDMENNPKIGVNGIKLLKEINKALEAVNLDCHSWYKFSQIKDLRTYQNINTIINTFNISLKTLTDRAIKSIFTEGFRFPDYMTVIVDYIEMKKELGLNLEDKLPTNVIELHDILQSQIEDIQEKEIKKQFEEKAKENKIISDSFNKSIFDEKFIMIAPKKSNDLIKEGQDMHHCVGSYIERFANGYSKIYFVRLKKEPNLSYVTIELDNKNNLIQAKAKFNAEVSKEVDVYIDKFINFIGGKRND